MSRKAVLWPWRDWMTIGIGVLASGKKKPDSLILAADALGSFGDAYSTAKCHKLFCHPSARLFCVAAGNVDKAAEFIPLLERNLMALPQRTHGSTQRILHESVHQYRSERFQLDVLPLFSIAPSDSDWRKTAATLGVTDRLLEAWNRLETGFQLIVGTFEDSGSALLYTIDLEGSVESCSLPGFVAIGTGCDNATFWLAYRRQNLGMNIQRSAYHAYEAKLMAEESPHVGKKDLELLIVSPEQWFLLSEKDKAFPNCPVSFGMLEGLWKFYGARPTQDLDEKVVIDLEGVDPAWSLTPEGRTRSEEIFRRNEDKLRPHILTGEWTARLPLPNEQLK